MNDAAERRCHADSWTAAGAWLAFLRRYLAWTVAAHLVWEMLQLPLYTIWTAESLAYNAFAVAHCTGGDLIISGSSLALSLVLVGSDDWPGGHFWRVGALATAVGVVYTVYSEWLNTGVRAAWSYSEAMPVLPGIGIGLSPLLQWLVLPPLGLWLCRPRARE
jgi:hypothetical protein